MRDPDWATADGRVRLYCGDSLEVLDGLEVDRIIVDPVWPNCPPGLLAGSDRASSLLNGILNVVSAKTVVVMLGFDSDPRFLQSVPRHLPFVRSQQMPYAIPSYRGRLLGGDEMAYAFGEIPRGRGVIPGRLPTVTDKKADRATGHPCPRADEHLKALVKWWSCDGDVICDPFAGTFSTGVGAVAMGRSFIGCEIDENYFALGVERIKAELERAPLFDERPKYVTRSLPGIAP